MSKKVITTYYCDNHLHCSSEQMSGSGLPIKWISVTYKLRDGLQLHRQYCSINCLKQGADRLSEMEDEQDDTIFKPNTHLS